MSLYHYYIVELDLLEVVGACTNNGNPGFSTTLSCNDQSSYSTSVKTHKFTDSGLILAESDIHKCVTKVSETTPKLKAGNGVASRAKCVVNFRNFVGDPNLTSPALVADSSLEDNGTFFGKLKQRNILTNRPLRIKYFKVDSGVTTLVRTNHYICVGFKQAKSDMWTMSCQDILYKADNKKSQFPRIIKAKLTSDITAGETSIAVTGDIADWTAYDKYTAVIGNDLLMITNATGSSTSVTLTVVRSVNITLGSRSIINEPSAHDSGDEVFRGRKFANADLFDVIEAVFEDADMLPDDYDSASMISELDVWLPSIANSVDAIFYEPDDSDGVLDDLCAAFMIDIYTDTSIGKATLKATSPWNTTTAVLTEGVEITFNSVDIDEPSDLFYSRAFLQYDKRRLLENDDDVNFKRSSIAVNTDLEGSNFYGEKKVKKMGKSIILSNKSNNIEVAELTTVRYAQRFSNRPQTIDFDMEEDDVNFKLGDVLEVRALQNQDNEGNVRFGVRTQAVQITPSYNIGRTYKVKTITYNPFIGGISGSDLPVNSEFDNNMFTIAGGPVSSGTFTFVFDKPYFGQNTLSQAITTGSFPSGSTVNLVFINGAVSVGRGGDGGNGSGGNGNGSNGGLTLKGTSGTTVNIYLSGTTPDFGNGTYAANGKLIAAGGGGGGSFNNGGSGGGGGAGFIISSGGTEPNQNFNGDDGTQELGGNGGGGGGNGGDAGQDGNDGDAVDGSGSPGPTGGLKGNCLNLNSGTINIITNGDTARFIQGGGDAPSSIS
jgi:hypothetical protein